MNSRTTTWAVRATFLALLALLAVFCVRRSDFSTDITNFMPDAESAELALVARHLTKSDLARTMFLTVGPAAPATDRDATARIARVVGALGESLARHPEVEWLRTGPQEQDFEQLWKLYFPRRFGFVSLDPERDIPALATPEAISRSAARAREALASPAAALVKGTVAADPLGFSTAMLERLREETPAMDVRGGRFFSRDGWGVLMLATRASAFDARRQGPLLDAIEARFAEIRRSEGADLVLEKSGANRFAVDTERSMMRDMWWIAGLSMAGIAALVVAYFRSVGRFAAAMLPSVTGMLVATAAGIGVFGRLDGLTLAFGASLIGVAIDYPVHLLNHLALVGGRRIDAVRTLAPSLSLGALTTVAGFAGLAITSFPGFREIGFFAAVGVAAALATTRLVVPWFVGAGRSPTRVSGMTARVLAAAVDAALRRRAVLVAIPIGVAVLGATALPHIAWEDDLSRLGNVSASLEQEERRVHARVMPYEMGRVVVAVAASEQEALERSEELARRLAPLRDQGAIRGFRSATNLVRSQSLQARNIDALRSVPDLAGRVRSGFAAAGFKPEAFDAFARDLEAAPPPLVLADLRGTAAEQLVAPLLLSLDGRAASITQISDPRDEPAVREAVQAVPGAHYFVQRDFVNELYAGFRDSTLEQLFLGGALVILTLVARYRRWRPTLAAFLPSLLVPVVVLSGFALAGEPVNLLHVVSLIMVSGMGVDYGIFLVDTPDDRVHFETTLVSLLLCSLTTVFGFAVVAVSSHPALRAMGITIGSGVLLSLVLSPVSLLVMGRRPQS